MTSAAGRNITMRIGLAVCALAISLAICSPAPAASDKDLPVVKPKVKTLAAFKNGLGFVYKSAETNLAGGCAMIDQLPGASLGALWIGTGNPDARIAEVISCKGALERDADPMNIGELLEANVGKTVGITYTTGQGPAENVHGTLLAVPKDRQRDPTDPSTVPLDLGRPSYYDYYGYSSYYRAPTPTAPGEPEHGQLVILKKDNGDITAINKMDIRAVDLPPDAKIQARLKQDVNSARVRVSGNPGSAEITLAYLEKGVTWSPSYLIDIKDSKMANITLDGVLTNDVEDLEDTTVSFVVGYPNFAYSDVNTPLLVQQSVTDFVKALESAENRRSSSSSGSPSMANSLSQSVMYNGAAYNSGSSSDSGYSTSQALSGETNEDLYFYHQDHVTMKKGDRARYTIFNSRVPYQHVYLWEPADSFGVDYWGYRRSDQDRKEQQEQVWHAITLENSTKVPWTTAPAFAMNGPSPVAQDILKYTPPSAKNTMKLTVATDVRANQTLSEVSRTPTKVLRGTYYLVTVNAKLTVKNLKSEAVKTKITKTLVGEVTSPAGGQVVQTADIFSGVNRRSEVSWEFTLQPNEEKTIELTYTVYVS